MNVLEIWAKGRELVTAGGGYVTSGSKQYDLCRFELSEEWDEFVVTCVFFQDRDARFEVLLNENGECFIPNEVLTEPYPVFFGLVGVNGETVLTSKIMTLPIAEGALRGNENTSVTPELIEQMENVFKQYVSDALKYRNQAETYSIDAVNAAQYSEEQCNGAADYSNKASQSAISAKESATAAEQAKTAAETAAETAQQAKAETITAAETAIQKAAEAEQSASAAAESATAAEQSKTAAETAATAALEAASRVSELEPTIEAAETTISNLQDKITQGDIIVAQVEGYSESAEAAADQAEFYAQQAQEAASGDMFKATYDTNADGVVDDSEKLGGQLPSYYAKASDIPVVPGVATTTSNGLMSSNDKTKLDSIGASGTFTLSSASWSVGSSVVTQTAAVSGITATEAYIFDIVPTNANEVKAYGYIGKIESVSGGFRATCYDVSKYPTVNLTIQYRRIA